jgi:uncharacterized protein YpiB (UPF0302 family)
LVYNKGTQQTGRGRKMDYEFDLHQEPHQAVEKSLSIKTLYELIDQALDNNNEQLFYYYSTLLKEKLKMEA